MEARETPPDRVWRGLGLAAVSLLVAAVVAIVLISAGTVDPKPIGDERERWQLQPTHVASGAANYSWLEQPAELVGGYSLRLSAALLEGETDVGYGLALGDPGKYLAAAVSPLGYVAVWQGNEAGVMDELLPWQPWPHVARGEAPNELQVDVDDGNVAIRVNRELLWQGPAPRPGGRVALYAESFGSGTVIDFQELVWFQEAP